jgi:hypothetical protein
MSRGLRNMIRLLTGIMVLSAVFANVEIQVEGADGWAARLPTWRIESGHILTVLWAGREITGYHVWTFLFMLLVFHFVFLMVGRFSVRLEARLLGSLLLFWVIEDTFWFVFNPAYGLSRLRPEFVPWHPCWILGVPVDYLVFGAMGLGLVTWSYWSRTNKREGAA